MHDVDCCGLAKCLHFLPLREHSRIFESNRAAAAATKQKSIDFTKGRLDKDFPLCVCVCPAFYNLFSLTTFSPLLSLLGQYRKKKMATKEDSLNKLFTRFSALNNSSKKKFGNAFIAVCSLILILPIER